MKVRVIVTHHRPHLDEIVSIWILRKFGESTFPGVSTAKVEYWSTGGATIDGRTPEEWEADGYILIGVGRGRFDEHCDTTQIAERQNGECAATLVAKALGVYEDPALEGILKYTLSNDSKGSSGPFEIASIVQVMHARSPENPSEAVDWVLRAIDVKYWEQYTFFNATKPEFESLAKIEKIIGPNGRELTFVFLESDNEQINKFARSSFGANADVVAIKRSSGNVQIFFNQRAGIKPFDLIRILRAEEQSISGDIICTDWRTLSVCGKAYDGDVWYLMDKTYTIMNGSLTAKGVPPTKIPFEKVLWAIKTGLNPDQFEDQHSIQCRTGKCTKDCSFYKYGLSRCKEVRYMASTKEN